MDKLLLRPEFITSASLYLMLKGAGFFGTKQVYVISPADLDFAGLDPKIKSMAINSSATDVKSKVAKIPPGSYVLIDGVMLHEKLGIKVPDRVDVLYVDTLGLPLEYRNNYDIRVLRIKTPELLYKTAEVSSLNDVIDLLPEYRHVIFDIHASPIINLKEEISKFNEKSEGVFRTNIVPIRNINNCDFLHMITIPDPWDFEYLVSLMFRSIYTSKDLRVIFYIDENNQEAYSALAQHLTEHLQAEDSSDYEPLVIRNGVIKW